MAELSKTLGEYPRDSVSVMNDWLVSHGLRKPAAVANFTHMKPSEIIAFLHSLPSKA